MNDPYQLYFMQQSASNWTETPYWIT